MEKQENEALKQLTTLQDSIITFSEEAIFQKKEKANKKRNEVQEGKQSDDERAGEEEEDEDDKEKRFGEILSSFFTKNVVDTQQNEDLT